VPVRALAGHPDPGGRPRRDRFFPVDFERRIARERLHRDIDVVPGGHLSALSRPCELADHLLGYLPYLRAPR
jgi:hypothetical protein